MLRTLFTRFQPKTKTIHFPLKIEGLSVDETLLKSRYVPMNQRCRLSMANIFEEDLSDGFAFAFKHMLAAFEEKDLSFFKKICEPGLYQEIKKSLKEMDEQDLYIKSDFPEEIDLGLRYTAFSFVYGVSPRRSRNSSKAEYQYSNLWNLKNGIDFQFYKPQNGQEALYSPFLKVACLFACPSGIYLKKNGEVILGDSSPSYHKVVFEGVGEVRNVQDAKKTERAIWQSMSNSDSEEKYQLIRDTFQTEKLTWKIADIDDYMNGNPYVV